MKIENKKAYIPCEIVENQINNGLDIRVRIDKTHDLYINRKLLIPDIDQPKPLVPQFILDWVDDSREHSYEFDEWFYYSNQPLEVYKWLNTKNKRQKELNALALVTLIVNGPDAVTVEKEKLYTVEIPNPNRASNKAVKKLMLFKTSADSPIIEIGFMGNPDSPLCKLTEAEIRKDFDWAWQWKKEVTE
ncbi:hypothetical protein Javan623_0024 [Streptococcus phage Javan623]|uniref:DUF1642 domain-containing protein n=1 Tax=Streptococcus uberis TaxID=1349 RepID=UPI000620F5B7|nr:DUF1642 domain-containing protein [Streptococcus uberis]KKF55659.1 hypothetical protein AF66_02630 [Streptococcus uberis B190]QBX21971.1 hypothetical protein Javan623_0024 [Streptococcus phage Javan623]